MNPDVLQSPFQSLFSNDFWGTPLTHTGSHKSYRPLTVLSFRLNAQLTGLNPYYYHLTNVLLHVLVTCLFTTLARKFLHRTSGVATAGLCFAAHPIHTEAVAGVVGRADVGAALFFLLSFFSYMNYMRIRDMVNPSSLWLCLKKWFSLCICALSATASMFTKEHGITVLAVCIMYDLFIHARLHPKDLFFNFQVSLNFISGSSPTNFDKI